MTARASWSAVSRLEPSLSRARVLGVSVGLRQGRKNVQVERALVLLGADRYLWCITMAMGAGRKVSP